MHKLNIIKPNNAKYRSKTYKSFKIKLLIFLNKFYKTHFMLQLLYFFSFIFFLIGSKEIPTKLFEVSHISTKHIKSLK